MQKRFTLVFDEVILQQFKELGKHAKTREMISKMFDKMELLGPRAGVLVDSQLFIYEMKAKRPPIRLYYRHNKVSDELEVFEYEMKTSERKQKQTIHKLRVRVGSKSQDPRA